MTIYIQVALPLDHSERSEMLPRILPTSWPQAFEARPPAPDILDWHPTPVQAIRQYAEISHWMTMGEFSSRLRRAGILDNKVVDLPGSYILLPNGVRQAKRLEMVIADIYTKHGLNEYEYPSISPTSIYDKEQSFFNMENKLLHVGTDRDFADGTPRATLCPTGEATIYHHWSRLINSEADLPLRMYRRARYFRPMSPGKHSGRSVFRSMEASDVYEFHAAYASAEEVERRIFDYRQMLNDVAHQMCVPLLWSTRPPWTNNMAISEWTLGGDTFLPVQATLQVACLYNQGQIFSRAYNISFKRKGQVEHTHHVAGAITRRLLFAHYLLGTMPNGNILIHPDVAADQIAVIVQQQGRSICQSTEKFIHELARLYRIKLDAVAASDKVVGHQLSNYVQGIPLQIIIQEPRHPADNTRIILFRADTQEEHTFISVDFDMILPLIAPALYNIGTSWESHVENLYKTSLYEAHDKNDIREALLNKMICIYPVVPGPETTTEIDGLHLGEVLGFVALDAVKLCVVTGKPTRAAAIVSSRV